MTLSHEALYQAARDLAEIQAKIAMLTIEADSIKEILRHESSTVIEPPATLAGSNPVVLELKVQPNTRIDDKLAREHLDEETYNTVSKRVIDTAKARAFLTAESIEKITKTYDNKVTVTVK